MYFEKEMWALFTIFTATVPDQIKFQECRNFLYTLGLNTKRNLRGRG